MEKSALSVLIVDDHEGMRGLLRSILEKSFKVVGEACEGESACRLFQELQPDIVLLDISMPGIDGFEVARRLLRCCSRAQIVFCSESMGQDYVNYGMSLGALGYIRKSGLPKDLVQTMSRAAPGTWSSQARAATL